MKYLCSISIHVSQKIYNMVAYKPCHCSSDRWKTAPVEDPRS